MPSTIQLYIAPDLSTCLDMHSAPSLTPPREIVVLPSSLNRRDSAAAELRSWLRSIDIASHLLVPESIVPSTFGRRRSSWSQVEAGSGAVPVSLPTRLTKAQVVWTVSDIDVVGGRGPYVLDLPVRYANPRTRLSLLGSQNRALLAVSILRARPVELHLIVCRFPAFTLLATSSDPIAAELFSLALVDEELPGGTQVIGPWEDDFVQRASELELGVRLPSDLHVVVQGIRQPVIEAMIGRIVARMGMEVEGTMYSHPE
ncbi:MAG TPA: hypothetical protein VEW66_06360 [Thermomicrobiales bacterium]|nr:hypothetical protein [Thermomicrobiales bacterium]